MFDIKEYLEQDYEISWVNKLNISIPCPWCGKEDNHFTIHIKKPVAHCYRCSKSTNWAGLIAKLEGVSYSEAKERIDGYLPFDLEVESPPGGDHMITLPLPELSPFSDKAIEYLKKRRVSKEMVFNYKIGYTRQGKHKDRLIFPITLNGKQITFQSRSVYERGQRKKYLTPKGSPLGSLLYGYDNIPQGGDVFIVEGVFDALNLVRDNLNAVGSFGKKISKNQLELIKQKKIRKLILAWDIDALQEIRKNWFDLNMTLSTKICLIKSGDPGDLENPSEYINNHIFDSLDQVDNFILQGGLM
jgi:DNA primase